MCRTQGFAIFGTGINWCPVRSGAAAVDCRLISTFATPRNEEAGEGENTLRRLPEIAAEFEVKD